MADAIHFNTIGSTLQNELRSGFAFHAVDQKDERDILLHLAQGGPAPAFLASLELGYSATTRSKSCERSRSSELLGSHNYIRADRESHPLEFMQAALNICQGTMNKEDSHEISSELRYVESGSSFNLLEVEFRSRRHGHPLG